MSDFDWLYEQLRRYWLVFRRAGGDPWTSSQVFQALGSLDQRFRSIRLATLSDADIGGCWTILDAVKGIKPTKAPSVVAISKFLHFWNPRLFVIVDDAVMWQRVLSRSWVKPQIESERARLCSLLPDARCADADPSCDLLSYLAVLSWAAALVRANDALTQRFAEYVRAAGPHLDIRFPLDEYDAGAVEWVLLGLAEIPPPGVQL